MTKIPSRTVEMFRMNMDDRTWDTVMVELPANTRTDRLEDIARIHAVAQCGAGVYMLYNSMDDECPDIPQQSEVQVRLSFDMDQITAGTETEQQAAAVEQINLTLQRQPYRLGANISMLDE